MSKRLNSKDVASMIGGGNPLPSSNPGQIDNGDLIQVRRLKVDLVKAYSGNPRHTSNEKFLEIKDSIAAVGLQQRIHVTKHPSEGWVTARGGCTRLEALHALAKELPARFGEMDFLEVPFKSDIELTIAHLSENIQRSDMTFWDTAIGVMDMKRRFMAIDATAQEMNVNELAQKLSINGLPIPYKALIDYSFLVESLRSIPNPHQKLITRNDIRNELRPHKALLLEFCKTHFAIESGADFDARYLVAVGQFSDSSEFSAARLIDHINSVFAAELGLDDAELPVILAAFKLDKTAPLQDLLRPSLPTGGGQGDLSEGARQGAHMDLQGAQAAAGGGAGIPPETGGGMSDAGADDDGSDGGDDDDHRNGSEDDDSDQQSSHESPARRSPGELTGAPGLQVVSGDRLQRTPVEPNTHQPGAAAAQLSSQSTLDGMSLVERAKDHLQETLQGLAEACGLGLWLNPDDAMPNGFWVELPSEGAVVSSDSILLHGWWFLVHLSGQFSTAIEQVPVDSEYASALSSEEAWQDAVAQRLAGAVFGGADFLVTFTTEPAHPLSDLGLKALAAMREWKFQQESQKQGEQS